MAGVNLEPPHVCAYCGRRTFQSPVRIDDVVYPGCCWPCLDAGIWRSIPVEKCDPKMLRQAAFPDASSLATARDQWAFDAIMAERGRQRDTSS